MPIHIGLSSFYNKKWKGLLYPEDLPNKDWFGYYTTRFDTFEINATFYRFPTAATMQAWREKAPEGFRYSVKAPKSITHIRRFEDTTDDIRKFYDVCDQGLGNKLSKILFQVPPSFVHGPEKLENILAQLDKRFDNVMEFRHASWWRQDVFDALKENGVTFCSVGYPGLPNGLQPANGKMYVRLHGEPRLFYSEYGKDRLLDLARDLKLHPSSEVFVYFNNTASEAAVHDALLLQRSLENL